MKKALSIILAILMIVTTVPFAFAADVVASGACGADGDNLTWSLDSDGVLTISGEGEMQEIFIYAYQPWEDYDDDIKEVVIEEGVTKIARAAFYALKNLEKVTISSTAEFEDFNFCFFSCTSLKEVIVSPANPYYCTDEYGVVFSKDKKTLLKAVDLSDVDYVFPDTVTSVADEAFLRIKIKSLIVNDTSMHMAFGAEIGKLIVDCYWVHITAFELTTIEELVLTNKVRNIEDRAFAEAVITSAHYLGDSANLNIGEDNDGLTNVLHYCEHKEALAPTCTEIGWDAYEYCTACDYTTYVELPADPDAHTPLEAVKENEVAPKCDVAGSYDLVVYCDDCGAELDRDTKTVDALTHTDADGDYICDHGCGHEFEKPAPEEPTPDTPDEPEDETCADCGKVHTNFFSEIICFFTRIFNFIKNLFA